MKWEELTTAQQECFKSLLRDSNQYDGGGWLSNIIDKALKIVGLREESKLQAPTYRGRPAEMINGNLVPKRVQTNNSPTPEASQKYEDKMRNLVVAHQNGSEGSKPEYDIPYIPEKRILIGSTTTSTNVLDSLAKYAGIHNRSPRLSEHPILHSSKYKTPRQINMNEMLGLSFRETSNGAWPYMNTGYGGNDRAISNSNYFTAFGYIPADNLMRDFHYNATGVSRNTPPILDAFRYYAQGDYNRGDKSHTKDVNASGKEAWKNQKVKDWWKLSGQYWYNTGKGPKK